MRPSLVPFDALRWVPTTEAELQSAANNGTLEESHYLDLKQELKPGQSGNKDLAKDIAAFSIDGGVIVFGVAENEGASPSLHAIDTAGLSERVEQIARTRVDAQVQVTSTVIESTAVPGRGYLVVRIPQSPRPPHMADGRYYARGDKTNIVLSDPDVVRLHERSSAAQSDLLAEVDAVRTDLDVPAGVPMLIVLGEPVGAAPDLLTQMASDEFYNQQVNTLLQAADDRESIAGVPPSFRGSYSFVRRPNGVAVTTGMRDGQRFTGDGGAAEIVFEESGRVVLASERPVDLSRPRSEVADEPRYLMDELILGQTRLAINLAAGVSDQFGFTGTWRFAVVIDGLRGAYSIASAWPTYATRRGSGGYDRYTKNDYRRTTAAPGDELRTAPGSVVARLVGSLLRSVGSYTDFVHLLQPEDGAS
ncbi:Putative DNA-binding domain-containing protein [Rhodococcoides kroppenstedtii]|uniref:Putative DNA-binding domain-containing protein n=1 Tax=Rhodococcoides kroppenstedtii TaxID=293050 RepID=A0A1I0UEI2_9NOCA|nr:Putative DNA-binding domain-containing protein [Rhodococcus kroppenstedtii]